MEITISEIYCIIKSLEARADWVKNEFKEDAYKEEDELFHLCSALTKFKELRYDLEIKNEVKK